MMFHQKFVVALKSKGKVLREFKDTVAIPFGSEYSVYLKNLNAVKAVAHITIDGQEVCADGFVIGPNEEVNIERFVKDLSKGNRFKFIKRSAGIEKHRGIGAEDGLVRVSFRYAQVLPDVIQLIRDIEDKSKVHHHHHYHPPIWYPYPQPYPRPYTNPVGPWWGTNSVNTVGQAYNVDANTPLGSASPSKGVLRNHPGAVCSDAVATTQSINTVSSTTVNLGGQHSVASTTSIPVNSIEPGITVPGSVSNQKFRTVASFPLETEEHVIVFKLMGETETGKEVKEPVTVKTKSCCTSCGRNNKSSAKFCSSCGTGLEII